MNRLLRRMLGALLKLRPPQYSIGVDRNLAVPMPDGVHLMTDHYFPKAQEQLPTVLVRSYYGRGTDLGGVMGKMMTLLAGLFAERGYHLIFQTTRGRFDSEGETEPFVDAAPDGQATLEWIMRQPWSDGNVGMWGTSYLGYVQWAIATDPAASPALKAIVPTIISSKISSLFYSEGAFCLDTVLRWAFLLDMMDHTKDRSFLENWRRVNPRGAQRYLKPAFDRVPLIEADVAALGRPVPFYRDWLEHPDSQDPYWEEIDHDHRIPQVTAPAHLISGWYDIALRGLLDDYQALQKAGREPYLTIGPGPHTDLRGMAVSLQETLAWLDAHLNGDRTRLREKPVRIYIIGAEEWREMESWPPQAKETPLFLHDGGRLSLATPQETSPPDTYRYDPADPTPNVGGPLLMPPSGPLDNRLLESRPDIVCYTTEALDSDLEVIGPVRLELFARSSLEHTDFIGRLCDVDAKGRSINVCDGLIRVQPGRGESQPDGSLKVVVDMWATARRFRQGHRLRLQVASGAHPRWSRNLGTGEPIGRGTRMATANQIVYHDTAHPSALILPITSDL